MQQFGFKLKNNYGIVLCDSFYFILFFMRWFNRCFEIVKSNFPFKEIYFDNHISMAGNYERRAVLFFVFI